MANIFKIFSNGLVQGTDDDDCITVLAGNATIEGKLGNDKIFTLVGNNKIYGDLSSVSISVVAGVDTPATGGDVAATYGNDCVYAGLGNDIVVGDVGDLLLQSTAGTTTSALLVGTADALLQNVSLTMGTDTLYGGFGNDSLYGDVKTLTLESIAGTANAGTNAGNQSANARIQLFTFNGSTDHLYGGQGNDNIYGDIGTLELTGKGGTSSGTGDQANGRVSPVAAAQTNFYNMGADFLYGDSGNDTLVGDIGNLNLNAISGIIDGGSQARGQIIGNTFNFGADQLHGDLGDDKLFGDVEVMTAFAKGGTVLSSPSTLVGSATAFLQSSPVTTDAQPVLFNMAIDHLYGDEGNDSLYGDIGILSINGISGNNNNGLFAAVQIRLIYFMGADVLEGGEGNDVLYGDMGSIMNVLKVGTISGAGFGAYGVSGILCTMGIDVLEGENGNDVLYGDVGQMTFDFTAGTNASSISAINIGSSENPIVVGAVALAGTTKDAIVDPFNTIITMGADELHGGNGDDTLFGDVGNFDIKLTSGTNTGASTETVAAAAFIDRAVFTMGNDQLDGGAGNDQLFGDLGALSAVLTNGTGIGTTSFINGTLIQFGNDTLIGGSGDDVLVGDIADPSQLSGFLNAPNSSIFTTTPATPNSIIFGNDTFVFTLCGNNGKDIIKDMNGGATTTATTTVTNVMDTLKFTDVNDVGAAGLDYLDVDAAVSFSNSGGHVKMSFAGGSVLFENINYTGQNSVLDITPNVIVV